MTSSTIPTGRPGVTAAEPTPRRNGGRAGLLALHVATELRATARSAEFLIGAVAIPALLFAMIGLPNADRVLPGGTRVGAMMLVAWTAYGIVSLAIFTFGEQVAQDRGRGWIRTMRATPLPLWSYLGAKLAVAVVCAALVVASTSALAATAGGVALGAVGWAGFAATMVAGVLAFSTMGFTIAYLARPRAAVAIANLVFLPLSFLSGFFVPLSELPGFVQAVARWLPTHHLGQLAWQQVAVPSDVEAWIGAAPATPAANVAWVLASAALFAGLAVVASRREAVTRRS